jgi:hypothetical protein
MKKLILAILFLNMACHEPKDTENCHYSFKIRNNTNRVIYMQISSDTTIGIDSDPRYYSLPLTEKISAYAGNNNAKSGELSFISNGKPKCAEDVFRSNELFYILVFDSIEMGKKEWAEIVKNYQLKYRFKFKFEELQKNNFTINYNGEEGYYSNGLKNE